MAELPRFDKDGKSAGTVKVDEEIFGDKVKRKLLHQVVIIHEANQRQGNASTKTRGEVEGSTRKPWPQKHTGMARAGTTRSPLWRHGGVVHGPKPKDYRMTITSTMRRAALDSALLGKIRGNEVGVIDTLAMEKAKTKRFAEILENIGWDRTVLVGTGQAKSEETQRAHLASRNLGRVKLVPVADFNAYDVLKHQKVLLTKEAFDALVASRKETKA